MEKQFNPGKAFIFRHLKIDAKKRIDQLMRLDRDENKKKEIDEKIEFQKQVLKNNNKNLSRYQLVIENKN
jgi:hypothetical protein